MDLPSTAQVRHCGTQRPRRRLLDNIEQEVTKSVALYWDFENIHASLCEERFGEGAYSKPDSRFKPQEPLVDVLSIIDVWSHCDQSCVLQLAILRQVP